MTNFADRTIWTGDNLDILRGLNSASVDLIYLDPPFNSNRNYAAPVGSAAAGAAFKDTWTLSDLDVAWMGLIADEQPAMYQVLQTAGLTHGKGMQSYLCMMAVRLLEMRRVLKDTASVYLHCDSTASHYLKMLMDSIYGHAYFRNEITWRRTNAKGLAFKGYPRNADLLLYFSVSDDFTWNRPFIPHDPEYVDKFYRYTEPDTGRRFRLGDLTNPNRDRPNLTYEWNGHTRVWRWTKDRMQEAHDNGLIHYSSTGLANQKRYLDEMQGVPVDTIWDDVRPIPAQSTERVGYPTQKPLALLERIIKASSNEGDVVLDPFCGCATACVAAENLGRRWIGIDISPKGRRAGQHAPAAVDGQPVPQPAGDGPHRHPQAHRYRRAGAVPAEQARPVRPAGRPVQRMPERVPVPYPRGRPRHLPARRRPGQHREPAAALRSLQSGQE